MRNILVIFFLAAIAGFQPFDAHGAAIDEVQKLTAEKNYSQAINILQENLRNQGSSPELFFDLGVIYYKAGNRGGAVLNFEKALRLNPSMKQAKNNLQYVSLEVQRLNEALTGDKNLDPGPAEASIINKIKNHISSVGSNFWCIASIASFILCMGCVVVYMLMQGEVIRKIGFFGGGALLLISIVLLIFSAIAKSNSLATDRAVVMVPEAKLYSTPSAESKSVASPIVSGTELHLLSSQKDKDGKDWREVYLNNDYKGWLPADQLEVVRVSALE